MPLSTHGIKKLRSLQFFKEATAGTAGLATTLYRGLGTVKDIREIHFADEDIGLAVDTNRGCNVFEGCELEVDEEVATYEQIPYFFTSGIYKLNSGVADGGGSGYIYAYPFSYQYPLNDFQTFSLEHGDNQSVEFATYLFTKNITIKGAPKEGVTVAATLEGRSTAPNTYTASLAFVQSTKKITDAASGLAGFTTGMRIRVSGTVSNDGIYTVATGGVAGEIVVTEDLADEGPISCTVQQYFTSVSIPAVDCIPFQKAKLYIDDNSGSFGGTLVSNTLYGFTVKIETGIVAMPTASGELYFSRASVVKPMISATIIFEHNGDAVAEKDNWRNNVSRLLRLEIPGPALATAGAYTNKDLILDIPGMWEDFGKLDEDEGNDTIEGSFRGGYDPTAAAYATFTVVNELASLP